MDRTEYIIILKVLNQITLKNKFCFNFKIRSSKMEKVQLDLHLVLQ